MAVLLLGLAACSTSEPVATGRPSGATSEASAPSASTPSPTAPSSSAPTAPLGDVTIDESASLSVSPVDYGGQGVATAVFSTPVEGRPVSLQRKTASGWEEVATSQQDRKGQAEFLAPIDKSKLRAVALPVDANGKSRDAVTTPTAAAAQQWRPALSTSFSGSDLPAPWDYRNTGSYLAGGRQCSAPYPSNVELADGKILLSMTEETSVANTRKADAAGCKKDEYYRNAMVGTEGRFSLQTGLVAARAKFPAGQGMHGALWLQSSIMAEIDYVESYGYGKGLTSVIHVDHKRYPVANSQTYVNKDAVQDRAWWDQFHVYSVEWDRSELVFRIDGLETQRLKRQMPNVNYFLVLSLLSSDWEFKRLDDPVQGADGVEPTELPATMSVDWVKVWTPKA